MDENTVSDGCFKENLWYIRGIGYDLTEFIEDHPGGKDALIIGKGRDCTMMVLSYHFREVGTLLPVIEKYKTKHRCDPYNEYDEDWKESDLEKEIKQKIRQLIKEGGSIRIKNSVLLLTVTSYVLMWISIFYLLKGNLWAAFTAPIFGWLPTCILAHDGGHFACFSSHTANRVMSWASCPLYFNSVTWILQHIVSHHQFTNDIRRDVDMYHGQEFARSSPVLKLESYMPFTVRIFIFGIQMLLSTWAESILYPLLLLRDLFTNSSSLFQIIPNKHIVVRHFLFEMVVQLALSLVIFMIPFFNNETTLSQKLFLSLIPFNISSVIFISLTQWAHLSEKPQTKTVDLDSEKRNKSFAENQILRSLDINPSSLHINLITGGLNCQSLHHMLPKVHNSRYIDLYPEYHDICIKHGIEPNIETSILKGYFSYVKYSIYLNSMNNSGEESSLLHPLREYS